MAMKNEKKAQAAMEYLVTYGWAVLLLAVAALLLYLYVLVPQSVVPSSCTFTSGAYCNDIVVGTGANHVTKLAIFLTNTQLYPLANPALIVGVNNANTTTYPCSPNFVLAGGSVVCMVTLPVQTSLSQFLAGSLYLTGTYCGLSQNYLVTRSCTGQVQTYAGSFTSHVQPLINTNNIVLFTAQNASNPANNAKDRLKATVLLLGYPLKGATVNFTANVPYYKLQPNLTTTNSTGIATSDIWGTHAGSVQVNAIYAGITNSVTIQFTLPTSISFSTSGFAYCSQDTSTMVVFDGIAYTCSQWISTPLACGIGSSHTYNFSRTVSISSSIREIFNKVVVNGVSSTSNHSTIICPSANESIIANYTTQFYLTESANPSLGAASLTPGSNWYDNGSIQTLSETNSIGYFFNTWSCTGTGCYSGSSTSTTLPINAVIGEAANYYTTSTTSTTSTTTTSTSTTSSTTSTTTSISTTTVPANPSCGNYAGDAVFSSSTTLTCNVVTSNAILINSGVTVNENGFYMEANVLFQNRGTVTDGHAGGASGSGGSGGSGGYGYTSATCGASGITGGAAVARTSAMLGQALKGGQGGGGGGGGAGGAWSGYNTGGAGGAGGPGGAGGGIVEIYSGNLINLGAITVAGGTGQQGGVGGNGYCVSNTGFYGGNGGGGGGAGAGGTVLLAYTSSLTEGTVSVAAGQPGSGGIGGSGCGPGGGGGSTGDPGSGGNGGQGAIDCGNGGSGNGLAGKIITATWHP
ncbi:MAG: hypothetical protein KGH60_04825 [Candidatus Micrarchaeota archaeon]|nr:hypothetical protein [Candidatus Micrarchaeota archaeon]